MSSIKQRTKRVQPFAGELIQRTDCTPLLRQIRQNCKIHYGRHHWLSTKVYLDLIQLCGSFDAAMVLSHVVYWDGKGHYVPRDNEGEPLPDEHGNIQEYGLLLDFDVPGTTLGIPTRKFKKIVGGLADQHCIDRRAPLRWKPSPGSAANANWRVREGDWLVDLNWKKAIREATQDDRPTIRMPWAFRAMITREHESGKDWENGNGAHLLLKLMMCHTQTKTGHWNCFYKHQGYTWAFNKREEWAKLLRISEDQFDRLLPGLDDYLFQTQKGARFSKVILLRPNLDNIQKRWNSWGQQYRAYLCGESQEPQNDQITSHPGRET
jgi:hypothetical protein